MFLFQCVTFVVSDKGFSLDRVAAGRGSRVRLVGVLGALPLERMAERPAHRAQLMDVQIFS